MSQPITPPLNTVEVDKDLIDQAHLGQGVPSQDPDSPAQFPLAPEEADRERKSVLMGGGMVAGAATGAAIGAAVAGPVGVFVGGSIGAVAGTMGAAAAGTLSSADDATNPTQVTSTTVHAPITASAASGEPVETLDSLGTEFGIFYPRDHMVIAFQTRTNLELLTQILRDLGHVTTGYLDVTSAQMIEFAERNMQEAGAIAKLGTSVTTLQRFLDAAKSDAVFLVVPTPDDETADQVTTVLLRVPHLLAERYRMLAIETVIT